MSDVCEACGIDVTIDRHQSWHDSVESLRSNEAELLRKIIELFDFLSAPQRDVHDRPYLIVRSNAIQELGHIWGTVDSMHEVFSDPDELDRFVELQRMELDTFEQMKEDIKGMGPREFLEGLIKMMSKEAVDD